MRHTWYKCPGKHEYPGNCQFCDGGLGACTVCGGAEGTLTLDCCGFRLNKYILDAVYKGGLNFEDDEWTVMEVQDG